jgi:hypothetical protein
MRNFLNSIIAVLALTQLSLGVEIDYSVRGETKYIKKTAESMNTSFVIDYKITLYEPGHKKYMLFLGGAVSPDYDHFGNEIKINGFTQLGIEF